MKKGEGEYTLEKLGALAERTAEKVDGLTDTMQILTDTVEKLAIATANGFREVHERFGTIQEEIDQKFDVVGSELRGVRRDVSLVKEDVGEIKDTLHALEKAVDNDSITLINHEQRISVLERA